MEYNLFEMTLVKLNKIKSILQDAILVNNFEKAEEHVALIRDYKNCYFCNVYRKGLLGHEKGICDDCPLHKDGELVAGKRLSYNGCYKMPPYREMVRLAWWFQKEPSKESSQNLINTIDKVIEYMSQKCKRDIIDKIVIRNL